MDAATIAALGAVQVLRDQLPGLARELWLTPPRLRGEPVYHGDELRQAVAGIRALDRTLRALTQPSPRVPRLVRRFAARGDNLSLLLLSLDLCDRAERVVTITAGGSVH